MTYTLYFDGGKRQGKLTYGIVIYNDDELVHKNGGSFANPRNYSSNVAEYIALLVGLHACKKRGITRLKVFGDSQLIIYQINGIYRVKAINMKKCYENVKKAAEDFEDILFEWIPRTKNAEADRQGR